MATTPPQVLGVPREWLVTLGEGGIRRPAALSEAHWRPVVGLSLLGAQSLHGWVGRSQADEGRRQAWGGRIG